MRKLLIILTLPLFLGACWGESSKDDENTISLDTQEISTEQATKTQADMVKDSGVDLSNVIVVRMMVDGERKEATSVTPAFISKTGEGENESYTVFRFTKDKNTLNLFSRDPETGKGYQASITRQELAKHKNFVFPMIKEGKLKKVRFTINAILPEKA